MFSDFEEVPMFIPRILEVRPLDGFKVWLKFSDQSAGNVDLSHLAGKGVFAAWNDYENFRKVTIEKSRCLVWPDEIEIDADSLYLKLTGKTPEELFPGLKQERIHA
jgi:hypothetical protein